MDVGSQVAARGTGGTAADRREMHCSFPQRSGSLQQAEAFLGIKFVVNTHTGVHTLRNTGFMLVTSLCQWPYWFCSGMANLKSLQAHLN